LGGGALAGGAKKNRVRWQKGVGFLLSEPLEGGGPPRMGPQRGGAPEGATWGGGGGGPRLKGGGANLARAKKGCGPGMRSARGPREGAKTLGRGGAGQGEGGGPHARAKKRGGGQGELGNVVSGGLTEGGTFPGKSFNRGGGNKHLRGPQIPGGFPACFCGPFPCEGGTDKMDSGEENIEEATGPGPPPGIRWIRKISPIRYDGQLTAARVVVKGRSALFLSGRDPPQKHRFTGPACGT